MYLGRAVNHSDDVCRFLHIKTNKIIQSRDITWLKKTYQEYYPTSAQSAPQVQEVTDDYLFVQDPEVEPEVVEVEAADVVDLEAESNEEEEEETEEEEDWTEASSDPGEPVEPATSVTPRVLQAMKKLSGTWYNPEATAVVERAKGPGRVDDEDEDSEDSSVASSSVGVDDALVATDNYDALDPTTYKDIFVKPERFG